MAGLQSSQHLESETRPRREPPVRRFSLKRSCSSRGLYAKVRVDAGVQTPNTAYQSDVGASELAIHAVAKKYWPLSSNQWVMVAHNS
jgi:hypothetical protein